MLTGLDLPPYVPIVHSFEATLIVVVQLSVTIFVNHIRGIF